MGSLFSPALVQALARLETTLQACPPRGVWEWPRAARLRQSRHLRRSRNAWHGLKTVLVSEGALLPSLRLGTRWMAFPDLEGAYYTPDEDRVVLPSSRSGFGEPLIGQPHALRLQNLFVLLHESAHARLYGTQQTQWAHALPLAIRAHADPVWRQVPLHPGWGVFNEMVADAFAARWVLRLTGHHPEAVRMIEALVVHRSKREHPRAHYFHDTAPVLQAVLTEAARGERLSGPIPLLDELVCKGFEDWLKNGGEALCSAHVDEQTQAPLDPPMVRGLTGRVLGPLPFVACPALVPHLRQLQQTWPGHPIFRFSQSQALLRSRVFG